MSGEDGERPGSAITKAFRLLDALVAAERAPALHELAEAAGMPKASAHRMLVQLEDAGIVRRVLGGRRFEVGPGLGRLAIGALGRMSRLTGARDLMAGLVERTGETVNLGVLDGREVVYLERVECNWPLRVHLQAGSRVPLHATAMGKLILAFLPDGKRAALLDGPLPRLTPNTLDREGLAAQLPEIRERGFSINIEESTQGLIGVAVPVLDRRGALLAGLAIHAPISRFGEDAARAAVPDLRATAEAIARTLPEV